MLYFKILYKKRGEHHSLAVNFDVKDALSSGRAIVGKFDEIMENINQDRHIRCHAIPKELNIYHDMVFKD